MQKVVIRNLSTPDSQPIRALHCASFFCRLRGLTFHKSLAPDEGLLLVQTRESRLDAGIHMFFVFMDLGIIWINNARDVVDTCLAQAWRPMYFPKHPARYVLEISPARLKEFHVGDRLNFE